MVGATGYYSQLIQEFVKTENIVLFSTIKQLLRVVA